MAKINEEIKHTVLKTVDIAIAVVQNITSPPEK